ncbi:MULTISPECIES: hypothetical protein [unclassified Pseudomonas]|uniref:hypothetical protein n=1 Tax=unclassified Pseudomonas TaxID=196821 RepID=UPI0009F16A8E|nr:MULTISPECIES: hypothetical protein [unclassified Pseudomonas]QIH07929.1 hypothetical protein ATY02_15035 [Pseudomonas sp. BIOMIG1BAC]
MSRKLAMDMQHEPSVTDARLPIKRSKWRWRILFFGTWLIAAFLFLILLGLGVAALISGFDDELDWQWRCLAFGTGGAIVVLCLGMLKAAFVERSSAAT